VEDQDRPLPCGGPRSGQQEEGPKMMNVEQSHAVGQPTFGCRTKCMSLARSRHAEQGVTMPRSAPLTRGGQTGDSTMPTVEQLHAEREVVVPQPENINLCDEVETLDGPLTQGGPSNGEKGGRHMLHVEQFVVETQPSLGRSTTYMEIGRPTFEVAHVSEIPATNTVRALAEVLAEGEGGKSKVGASNLKFWKRQACVFTPNHGHRNEVEGVGQKRKNAQASGAKRSGKNNCRKGSKHQKLESGVIEMAEAVQ
jgi:hypothetical protein